MPDAEATPVKRGPGRPRKAAAKPVPKDWPPTAAPEVTPTPARPELQGDERIGLKVDNPAWTGITFEDNREYRIEKGVIVERVR